MPRSAASHSLGPSPGSRQSPGVEAQAHPSMMGNLPMRSPFPPPALSDTSSHTTSFVDVNAVPAQGPPVVNGTPTTLAIDMAPGLRDHGRRSSGFAEYSGSGTIYPQQWPMTSSSQTNSPAYAYEATVPNPQGSSFDAQTGPLGPGQPYMQGSLRAPLDLRTGKAQTQCCDLTFLTQRHRTSKPTATDK